MNDPDVAPVEIELPQPGVLEIAWTDGLRHRYPLKKLQEHCPCAGCREKRQAQAAKPANPFQVITTAEAQPLQLLAMEPVGNYAYHMQFNHGCNRGIWTFDHLRELGEPVDENL